MKSTHFAACTLCGLALLVPSTALFAAKAEGPKAKLMAKYDINQNGVIDGDEIAAVRKDFAAAPQGDLKRFDTNKDGKLDDAEIGAMKPPGGKGKGAKKADEPAKTDKASTEKPKSE